MNTIEWETFEGVSYAYLDDFEIEITAAVPYRAGYQMASNVRNWTIVDLDNQMVAQGTADGLRAAKKAATQALAARTTSATPNA